MSKKWAKFLHENDKIKGERGDSIQTYMNANGTAETWVFETGKDGRDKAYRHDPPWWPDERIEAPQPSKRRWGR